MAAAKRILSWKYEVSLITLTVSFYATSTSTVWLFGCWCCEGKLSMGCFCILDSRSLSRLWSSAKSVCEFIWFCGRLFTGADFKWLRSWTLNCDSLTSFRSFRKLWLRLLLELEEQLADLCRECGSSESMLAFIWIIFVEFRLNWDCASNVWFNSDRNYFDILSILIKLS